MELNRLARIVRARWWLFAAIGVAGLIFGVVVTSYLNRNTQPEFEATAPLAVIPDPGTETRQLEEKTFVVLDIALLSNQEILVANAPFEIVLSPDQVGFINFIATASTEERAAERAEGMRQTLVEAMASQATVQDDTIDFQQDAIRTRLAEIEVEIAKLEADRTPADLDSVVELQLKQAEFQAVSTTLNALYVERVSGVDISVDLDRTLADVEVEIVAFEAAYTTMQLELLNDTQTDGNQDFNELDRNITLLTEEHAARITEFGRLVLATPSQDVSPLGNAEILDTTSTPGSPITNGIAGLMAGLLVPLGSVIVKDKYRRFVWVGSDLTTLPFLGEVVQRTVPVVAGQAWYEFGGPASRKRSIQSVRVTVEGASEQGSALGIMGLAPSNDIHEFAADFAMSMVTSGSRLLLIDADFDRPSSLFEFTGTTAGGVTLSDLLQFRLDDEEAYRAFIKRSLAEQPEITEGLSAVQVGHGLADPADAVSGRRLQILLEEVRRLYDLTVFVAGSGTDATALATMTRLDRVIFTLRPGEATQSEVEEVHRQLATFGVPMLGGAMLTRSGRTGVSAAPVIDPVVEPPSRRMASPDEANAQDLLVEALLRERTRGGSAAGDGGLLEEEIEEFPADLGSEPASDDARFLALRPVDADLSDSTTSGGTSVSASSLAVISALAPAPTSDPTEAVSSLLAESIESVLRGFSGASTSQRVDPGVSEVSKYGFVPMVRIKGHKTIGARVLDALNSQIESAERSLLIGELIQYFGIEGGGRSNERVVSAINDWAREHYFTRHLVDTGREPQVWHVASQGRTFEGFIHVSRCTKERIDLFRSEILRRQIEALNKTLKAASKARRADQVRTVEEQIKDLRTFDIAWGWLFEGTTPTARLWYPWKGPEMQPQGWDPNLDEGVRANIAPLQRLGVLAQDVLTGEELLALSPAG